MRGFIFLATAALFADLSIAEELSPNQQLVEACFQLNQYRVVRLLRSGADMNAQFATHGVPQKTTLLKPAPSKIRTDWTPLVALANSARELADQQTRANYRNKRITILRILLSHGRNVDDDAGTRANRVAIDARDIDFARLLALFQSRDTRDQPQWDYTSRILDFLSTRNRLPTLRERRDELGIPPPPVISD